MLADAIAWALPEMRAEAEGNMRSTCTIREPDGEPTTNEHGEAVPTPGAVVYAGKCRIRPASDTGSTVLIGGDETFTFDYVVSIPFDAPGSSQVLEGMPCTIDTSPDAALQGVKVEIHKVARGDQLTARRLACNEVS